jgi:hypothetical protein
MISNASLVLNMFGTILTVYDLVDTSINVSKGSKSDLAKKLEKILEKMEEEEEESSFKS